MHGRHPGRRHPERQPAAGVTREVLETIPSGRGYRQLRDAHPRRDHEQLEPEHLAGCRRRHRLQLRVRGDSRRPRDRSADDGERHVGDLAHRHRRHAHQLVRRHRAGIRPPGGGTLGGDRLWRRVRQRAAKGRRQQVQRLALRQLRQRRTSRPTTSTTTSSARADRREQDQALFDINPSFGGPIRQDKLWFHARVRYVVTDNYVGGLYYNATPKAWTYTPDLSPPGDQRSAAHYDTTLNLTWQVSPKNRLSIFGTYDNMCLCHFSISPTSGAGGRHLQPGRQQHRRRPAGPPRYRAGCCSRLAASHYLSSFPRKPQPDATEPSIVEQSNRPALPLGCHLLSDAANGGRLPRVGLLRDGLAQSEGRVHLSVAVRQGPEYVCAIGDVNYRTLNGIPNQVTYYTTPYPRPNHPRAVRRSSCRINGRCAGSTVNAGLRYDQFIELLQRHPPRAGALAADRPRLSRSRGPELEGPLTTARRRLRPLRHGQDGAQVLAEPVRPSGGQRQHPGGAPPFAATNSIARTWTDANRDFVVQGDPLNPRPTASSGPRQTTISASLRPRSSFDPDWADRLRREAVQLGDAASRFRTSCSRASAWRSPTTGGRTATSSSTTTRWSAPADYDPYCITAPRDARLPGGGGQQICGLFDLKPAKVGQVSTLRSYSRKVRRPVRRCWNGLDITTQVRFQNGALLQGGMSASAS